MCSNMTAKLGPIVAITIFNLLGGIYGAQYFGKFIGKLSELHHAVSGEVYAVDGRTLFLKDFTYDGQGPTAYFYASTHKNPDKTGFRLRDENGRPDILRRYRKEGITLTLPEGKTLNSIKVFYVWCEEFQVNFGDVKIPRNFDYPRPQKIQPLKGVHAISSDNIVIVDAQTLLIPNLSFDGEAPDAKFWVGRGPRPSPQGIRVPDENGKELPLRRYDRKTVVLTLPGDLTVFDIGHFGIWCEAFTVDFGHVQIPQDLNVPPSLKMLGVSPQSKLNCEVLHDDLAFEVRWAVAGDSIVLQLVAKLDNREYMSFGVSGDDSKTEMIGGDPVVAWVDKTTLKGFAEDYYLASKSQCSGPTGSCPDNRLSENTNNIRLLNAAMVNGYSIVTYQRPLKPSDEYDRQIHTNKSQAIIWAIGPLNQRDEVSFHSQYTKGDKFIDFGRVAKWNCPMPENEQPSMVPVKQVSRKEIEVTSTVTPPPRSRNSERRRVSNRGSNKESQDSNRGSNKQSQEVIDSDKSASRSRQTERRGGTARRGAAGNSIPTPAPVSKRDPWYIPPIECDEPDDGVFYAQMGPTGGKRGYPAITGHVGWGISWYINGLLIPEVNVVRGQTYTFVVEGGSDPDIPAKYHPFYITDDPIGGFEYKTEEEKKNVTIFAGATTGKDRSVHPTGTGRLCHWTHQGDKDADDFDSFGAYQRTLELQCDRGEPGFIQWTPDKNTPDTVYYQCFTHRYLGWKINVHDSCDAKTAASEPKAVIVPAADLEESPSTIFETRVKPNDIEDEDKNKSTISEKSTVPPLTQLPLNEPILIQPQQNFLNPPLYHGALHTFQPYIFELPSFKSNPLVGEDIKQTLSSTTENLPKAVMNDEIIMPPPIKLSRPFKPNKHPLTKFPPRPMRYPPNFKKTIYRSKINLQRPHYAVMKTPQQVSTEKDPEIQTALSVLLSVQAEGANYHNLKPAKNTGFHPESIVMEGGFKPIISKELQRRKSELAPKLKRSPYIKKIIIKRPRNLEDEELVPAAAERVETYYLPPSGQVPKIPQVGRQRSNIDLEEPTLDLESPPDVVVTYDGRRVSGASLTARIADRSSVLDQRASKAAELIKARPQFVPFKGPLPPLNPDVINRKVPQQIGSINRDLDAPRQGGPTKLSLVRQLVAERDARRKREAHHTPEHTAQQKRGNGTVRGDASVITGSICMMASVVVALSYL